jgi:penicillin-binding protein 2
MRTGPSAQTERRLFTRRALLLGGVQTLIFGAIASRLYHLQVTEHPRYGIMARDNAIVQRLTAPERGLIVDRTGVLLADNQQRWRALFLMTGTDNPQAVIARFDRLVGLSDGERVRIASLLAAAPSYVPIVLKHDLDRAAMNRLEVYATALPGVIIERGFDRVYPLGTDAAHTVGYVVRPDEAQAAPNPALAVPGARVGGSGIEQAYNHVLLGEPGLVESEVNAHGSVVRVLDHDAGRQGRTVALTIDANLQREAVTALNGLPGSAVLLDATSGDVLAMASAPSFDPAWFDNGVPNDVWQGWMNNPADPLINRSTQGLYAPGSAFKPTVALAALRCGAITAETRFFCPGHLKIGDRVFYCWLRAGHGSMDAASALQQSCDVFYYQVAMLIGIDRMAAMGGALGLTGTPNLDFPDLAAGFLPTHDWAHRQNIAWTRGDSALQGIGQGYTLLTPLNLATMIARIGTGQAVTPHLLRAIGDEAVSHKAPESLGLPAAHLAAVRQGLDEVVNTQLGTSWGARLDLPGGIRMAGKTGTAQVINESAAMEAANYDDALLPWKYRPNALFVGYAPVEAPRFAAAVVVEHGTLLAPVQVARDLFSAAFAQELSV